MAGPLDLVTVTSLPILCRTVGTFARIDCKSRKAPIGSLPLNLARPVLQSFNLTFTAGRGVYRRQDNFCAADGIMWHGPLRDDRDEAEIARQDLKKTSANHRRRKRNRSDFLVGFCHRRISIVKATASACTTVTITYLPGRYTSPPSLAIFSPAILAQRGLLCGA